MNSQTLADLHPPSGRFTAAWSVALVEQVAAALDAVHAQGLTHGNISPYTINITSTGSPAGFEVTLRGFGTAPDLARTAATIAPERAQGLPPDARSDIYALAAVLYQLLSGRPPFVAETPALVLTRKLSEPPSPLDAAQLGLPQAFDAVVARGLDPDPARRFNSAGELAAAARRALPPASAPTVAAARPPTPLPPPVPPLTAAPTVPARPATPIPPVSAPTVAVSTPAVPAPRISAPTVVTAATPRPMPAPPTPLPTQPAAGGDQPRRLSAPLLIGFVVAALVLIGGGLLLWRMRGDQSAPTVVEQPTTGIAKATSTPRPARTVPPDQNAQPKQPDVAAAALPSPTSAPLAIPPTPNVPTPTLVPIPTLTPLAAPPAAPAALPRERLNISASGAAPPSVSRCGDRTTFDAGNAIDGQPETAWRVPGDGRGAFLQINFDAPVRVTELRMIPGYAKIDPCDQTDRFVQNRRVQRVDLSFSDGSHASAELRDARDLQSLTFPAVVASWVRVTIVETTAPGSKDGRDFTPISEIVVIGSAP